MFFQLSRILELWRQASNVFPCDLYPKEEGMAFQMCYLVTHSAYTHPPVYRPQFRMIKIIGTKLAECEAVLKQM